MKLPRIALLSLGVLSTEIQPTEGVTDDPCGLIPSCGESRPFYFGAGITQHFLSFDLNGLKKMGFEDCRSLDGCHVRLAQHPSIGSVLEWDNDVWVETTSSGAYSCRYRHTFQRFPQLSSEPQWCRRHFEEPIPSWPSKPESDAREQNEL